MAHILVYINEVLLTLTAVCTLYSSVQVNIFFAKITGSRLNLLQLQMILRRIQLRRTILPRCLTNCMEFPLSLVM